MTVYQTRKIRFKELVEINDWKIKIYTISISGEFDHPEFYQNVLDILPKWLELKNGFDSAHENIGFLILHSGKEGIFSLINWWVGKNMLNSNVFITAPGKPNEFLKISGDGLASCVWEGGIINHERISWINNVLKPAPNPDYDRYLADTVDIEL